jgi:sugar phosphate isomerase/epimerase
VLTTGVLNAEDPLDRKVVATASELGYDLYRTGWWRINDDTDIKALAGLARTRLQGLAELSQELGISGSYENHSGNFFGASIWALDQALEGLSPEHMGCQYDIQHAIVAAGRSWPIELRLIKDNINSLVVKDFKWIKEGGAWKTTRVPIGEGMVDFVNFFSLLKKYGIKVPVILHCEYDLGGAEKGGKPSIDHQQVFGRIQKDLLLIRDAWQRAG